MMDYEEIARGIIGDIQVDVIRHGTGRTTSMQIVVLPETHKEIAQALERADISGRIEEWSIYGSGNQIMADVRLAALRKRLEEAEESHVK